MGGPGRIPPLGQEEPMSRIKRMSPALVVAIVALVAALVVPALALTGGEKRVVKKLAAGQVRKLAPGLSVANAETANAANSANTAETANTAGLADNAANADKLDGLDASDFTAGDEVHTPGRFVLNDPVPGDLGGLRSDVLTVGVFTFEVFCVDNADGTPEDLAEVIAKGPSGSSFSGRSPDGDFSQANTTAASVATGSNVIGQPLEAGYVTMVAPSGEVVSANVSAEVGDPAGDCVVGLTAVGP
jgi:hypothetical protein